MLTIKNTLKANLEIPNLKIAHLTEEKFKTAAIVLQKRDLVCVRRDWEEKINFW